MAELKLGNASDPKIETNESLIRAKLRWLEDRTVPNAVEFVSEAVLFGKSTESVNAARFLINSDDVTRQVRDIGRHHLDGPLLLENAQVSDTNPETIQIRLREIKAVLLDEPRNSILHVEAARLYASLGQVKSAIRSFDKALAAKENNRFILRSAVRFFVHDRNFERAHEILRDVPSRDPWLMAALISSAELAGVKDRRIRESRQLLESTLPPGQISELASALATHEMNHGSVKRAKKLFRLSAQAPNDNSVAQLAWAGKRLHMEFDDKLLGVDLSFEARCEHAIAHRKWDEALQNCRHWLNDEPFSVRPALIGGYFSAEIHEDWQMCKEFAQLGLQANTTDGGLWNNLALAEAGLGNFEAAEEALKQADTHAVGMDKDVVIGATKGFLCYAKGDFENGAKYYEKALEEARNHKNLELAQRAALHWMREEMRLGNRPLPQDWAKIESVVAANPKGQQNVRDFFDFVVSPAYHGRLQLPTTTHTAKGTFSADKLLIE